jgi:hypothetical protein
MSTRLLGLIALLSLVSAGDGQDENRATTGVVLTLTAADDLTASVDLDRLTHSGLILDGQLILDEAELAYGLFREGALSFGFRTKEQARLEDLGDLRVSPVARPSDVSPKLSASVFHTLVSKSGRVQYSKPVGKTARPPQGQAIFANFPPSGIQHVVPEVGHVYLLRYRTPPAKERTQGLVKIQVLAVDPQQVTLRIAQLPGA